jgi:hypothetical protein
MVNGQQDGGNGYFPYQAEMILQRIEREKNVLLIKSMSMSDSCRVTVRATMKLSAKCLSIRQPYADLIVSGRKTTELRKWNAQFRGEFLVHTHHSMY